MNHAFYDSVTKIRTVIMVSRFGHRLDDLLYRWRIGALPIDVLACYMQILSDQMCQQMSGRIINIHHFFRPSFKGANSYRQAHARAIHRHAQRRIFLNWTKTVVFPHRPAPFPASEWDDESAKHK